MDRPGRAFGGAAEKAGSSQSTVDNEPGSANEHYGPGNQLTVRRADGGAVGQREGWIGTVDRRAKDSGKAENNWVDPTPATSDRMEIRNRDQGPNQIEAKSGGGIHIKPSHRGELHRDLGVPTGQKIPVSKMEHAKADASPAERKRITFAENARKWGK